MLGIEFHDPANFLVGRYAKQVGGTQTNLTPQDRKRIERSYSHPYVFAVVEQTLLNQIAPTEVPIGEIATIKIEAIVGGAEFRSAAFKKEYERKIGNTIVYRYPDSTNLFGEEESSYLFPVSDEIVIGLTANTRRFGPNTPSSESHYDLLIEQMIPTFKLINP